jgi:predicted lipid-binding transport protein (Tim44 family)
MTKVLGAIALFLAFGVASLDADAARRFGGGGSFGKQRATPTQREATPQAPAAPNQATPAKPAAAPGAAGAAAAKPSFMSRWGGLLAGLGIGVLLASLFGAQLGPIIGLLLAVMLAVGVIYLLFRLFAGKRPPAAARSPQFAGIGSGVPETQRSSFQGNAAGSSLPAAAPVVANLPADFEMQPFLRVAKSSFIRLQAANDAGDLADIRDYTTPEMFAEISLQMQERGSAGQKTDVVNLEAQLLDVAQEEGFDYASVRFYGLIRENAAANPEPFDEIWHVRRKAGDRKDPWLIAGIQQNPA